MINDIIAITKEAGNMIKEFYRKDFGIEYKTNSSNLVTEVDKKSEKIIVEFIKKKYPDHTILAEESGLSQKNSDYVWIIDPLDGTTNFAHGLPFFSVSVALTYKNEVIAGAVYDVMRDIMFSAEKGSGAFENGKRIKVSSNTELEKSFLVTGFPYEFDDEQETIFHLFKSFILKSRAVRRLGSAALDMCYVATGIFDGFWESSLNAWDICGAKIIIEEAGGEVLDYKGNPLEINIGKLKVLATNKCITKKMLEIIQEHNNILN